MSRRKAAPEPENPSEIEARATRLEQAAGKEEKALRRLAALKAQREEVLGPAEDTGPEGFQEGDPNGGPFDPFNSPRLEKAISEINNDGSFTVMRHEGAGQVDSGQYDIAEWPDKMKELVTTCGGGRFTITFRNSQGHYKGSLTRNYDPKIYGKPITQGMGEDRISSILLEMQKIQMQSSESHKRDMMELMKIFITAQNGKSSILSSAEDISVIGKLFADKTPKQTDPMEMVKIILSSAQDLAEKGRIQDPEDKEESGGSFLDVLVSKLGEALSKQVQQSPHIPIQQIQHIQPIRAAATGITVKSAPGLQDLALGSIPVPPCATVAQPVAVATVPDHPLLQFRDHPLAVVYVPVIVDAAERKMDPELLADLILDRIPGDYQAVMMDIVSRPDFHEVACLYDPRLRPFKEWLDSVINSMKEAIAEDSGEEAEILTPATTEIPLNGKQPEGIGANENLNTPRD